MCGIAGIMTADGSSPDAATLQRLGNALVHRGPDGKGMHLAGDVGLVQTRLAIIDLETGDQPIYDTSNETAKAALVANAEIYNYIELRASMPGVDFATASDCEPALHLYLRLGVEFAEGLRGMYAIAIHDQVEGRLVLARDPFGIKPLYYVEMPGALAFASEPQALLGAGLVKPELRPESRQQLLQLQFTTGRETAFEGICRVLPGETLVVKGGRIVARHRLAALPHGEPRRQTAAEALRGLDVVLSDSVEIHQRSDVPYGMFLSGGVDSSALLAQMARLNERPVRTFTAGFNGTTVNDERFHARAVAAAAGSDHQEVNFGEEDFWGLLPAVARTMDDPVADYAMLPAYKLAATAKEAGLKVILTGEGGDEMFGGYGRYRKAMRLRLLGGAPMRARGAFEGLEILREPDGGGRVWRSAIGAAEADEAGHGRSALQAAQAVDCVDWLPNDLLTKLDRCLMAHGVEGRVPFLDREIANFALPLPDRLKVRRLLGKVLLREWLHTKLPASKPFSRKRGFTVPVGEWMARRGGELGPLVAAQPGIDEICRPGTVERLFSARGKKQEKAAWHLLFFALWHRCHIVGGAAAGNVFETLAARS
jgi:asparagine synthase (glutamine-hydrolysing)